MTDHSARPFDRPLISVVVCTYNRAALLAQALETLAAQSLTRRPTRSSWSTITPRTTRVRPWPGSSAVQRALRARNGAGAVPCPQPGMARGARLVVVHRRRLQLPPDWLADRAARDRGARPGGLWRPYYAFYMTPKPDWFKDSYASHTQGDQARALAADEYLDGGTSSCGGGAARAGRLRPRPGHGREARRLWGGADLLNRLRRRPLALVYYDPDLYVLHLVKPTSCAWAG